MIYSAKLIRHGDPEQVFGSFGDTDYILFLDQKFIETLLPPRLEELLILSHLLACQNHRISASCRLETFRQFIPYQTLNILWTFPTRLVDSRKKQNQFTMANQVLRSIASSSLDPLPKDIRNGMIAMGIVGLLSTISTLALFLFITYRMIYWKRFFNAPLARNQAFVLIYNLLLADLHQALSFLFSFWWISQNKLVGPNRICDAQGWLIQVGDVSSGLWVLAIAVHTFISLVAQKQVPHGIFVAAVCLVWAFVLALAGSGPARSPDAFFVSSLTLSGIPNKANIFLQVPAGAWVRTLHF